MTLLGKYLSNLRWKCPSLLESRPWQESQGEPCSGMATRRELLGPVTDFSFCQCECRGAIHLGLTDFSFSWFEVLEKGVQRLGNLVAGLSSAKSTKWFSEISFPSLSPSFFFFPPISSYFPPTLRCEMWIYCLLINCPKSKVVSGGGTAEDVPSASLQNCSFLSSKSNTMHNGFTKLLLSLLLKNLI